VKTGLTLDQLTIGRAAERAHVVTDADLRAFADVSGDHNPVHLDEAYAAATPFKGRIAHGMLSGAYISAVIAGELPGPGTIYLSQSMAFKRPVRIGDEVVTRVEVTALDPEKGRVTLATTCLVNGKAVLEGEAVVLAPKPEAA
jgi:3-hydroxybutyryl-CoA dehydratase